MKWFLLAVAFGLNCLLFLYLLNASLDQLGVNSDLIFHAGRYASPYTILAGLSFIGATFCFVCWLCDHVKAEIKKNQNY